MLPDFIPIRCSAAAALPLLFIAFVADFCECLKGCEDVNIQSPKGSKILEETTAAIIIRFTHYTIYWLFIKGLKEFYYLFLVIPTTKVYPEIQKLSIAGIFVSF